MPSASCLPSILTALFLPAALSAHESFLPLHHHSGEHEHGEHSHGEEPHSDPDTKGGHLHLTPALTEERFAFATGSRFTRYSTGGDDAHLWEAGLGVDYAIMPWLHLGGEISYGWFDSSEGSAEGWLTPGAHLDLHLPLRGAWEIVAGLEVGFPGGEEALVGRHWEWIPHMELRYDPGHWFAEAGIGVAFVSGEATHDHGDAEDHDEEHDHDAGEHDEGAETHEHHHTADFHEIVSPHGDRELQYFAAAGVRLFDRRLTLESRVSGIRVLAGETPDENYVRAGLGLSFTPHERVVVTVQGSVPITDAERNQWQASAGLRLSF